jgi:CspA family cold shock protein
VVKFFNSSKGYGFITDDKDVGEKGIAKDYFFHFTNSLDKVNDGDTVSYDIETGARGLKAVNVKRIKK